LAGGLCAICGALLTFLILEKPVDRRDEHPERTLHEVHIEKQQDRRDMKAHAATLGKTVVSPALWVCVFYVFYLIITPGTLTAQFYYATSVLHFSPQFIGNLGMPYAAGAIVGTVLFLLVSKRLATAVIVWGAFFGDLSAYPLLFALHSHTSATIITFVGGITGQIYNLCLLTFAAKVCPKGIEASIYALFIAAVTLAGTLGDKIGSSIYDYYGPAHHLSITNGWHMLVWAGIVLTALSAVIIPFLPRWTISPKAERLRNQVA
jgi:Na+/melibiose symporter-like transporter